METTYNGNDVFTPFNAGLYGYDGIDFDESKDAILTEFKLEFEADIVKRLAEFGLEYCGLVYYSPQWYNFSTDSIDLKLKIHDPQVLREKLETIRPQIVQAMKDNVSYDGYIATTADDWEGIIDRGQVDILAVKEILKTIDFSDFEITDYMVWEDCEEDCEKCPHCDIPLENKMHDVDGTNLVETLTCEECGYGTPALR